MSKYLVAMMMAVVVSGCGGDGAKSEKVQLTAERIDVAAVQIGLPLINRENTKSGDGRSKTVWVIDGFDAGKFEVIGNNQSDADSISWNCSKFDDSGSKISQADKNSFCSILFSGVLEKFVTNNRDLAARLIGNAESRKENEVFEIGDFSFETDGEFYFVRRLSRIGPH